MDYVSKRTEVIPTMTKDAIVVVKFLRENIFTRFGMLELLLVIRVPTLLIVLLMLY